MRMTESHMDGQVHMERSRWLIPAAAAGVTVPPAAPEAAAAAAAAAPAERQRDTEREES